MKSIGAGPPEPGDTPGNYMSVVPGVSRRSDSDGGTVQPRHGRRSDGVAEGLELVVPGLAEGEPELAVELDDAGAGRVHGVADPVLGDDDVARRIGLRVEDAEIGRVQPPAAVDTVAGVFGDLEAQVLPSAQRGSNGGTGARRAFPIEVGALRTAEHRLISPGEADGT